MSETEKTIQLKLNLPPEDVSKIEQLATENKCSVDQVIIDILAKYIPSNESQENQSPKPDGVTVLKGANVDKPATQIDSPASRVGQDQFEPLTPSPSSLNSDGSMPVQKKNFHDSTGKPIVINQLEADPSSLPPEAMRQLEEIRKRQAGRASAFKKPTASGKLV